MEGWGARILPDAQKSLSPVHSILTNRSALYAGFREKNVYLSPSGPEANLFEAFVLFCVACLLPPGLSAPKPP